MSHLICHIFDFKYRCSRPLVMICIRIEIFSSDFIICPDFAIVSFVVWMRLWKAKPYFIIEAFTISLSGINRPHLTTESYHFLVHEFPVPYEIDNQDWEDIRICTYGPISAPLRTNFIFNCTLKFLTSSQWWLSHVAWTPNKSSSSLWKTGQPQLNWLQPQYWSRKFEKKFSTIPKSMATQSGPIHNQFSDIILSHSSQLFNVKSIMETFLAHFVLTWKADL